MSFECFYLIQFMIYVIYIVYGMFNLVSIYIEILSGKEVNEYYIYQLIYVIVKNFFLDVFLNNDDILYIFQFVFYIVFI